MASTQSRTDSAPVNQAEIEELAAKLGITPEQLLMARAASPEATAEFQRQERLKDLARTRIREALLAFRGGEEQVDPELEAQRASLRTELGAYSKAQLLERLILAELPGKSTKRGDGVGYAAVYGVYRWDDLVELGHSTVAQLLREALPGKNPTPGSVACYPSTFPHVREGKVTAHGRAKRTF